MAQTTPALQCPKVDFCARTPIIPPLGDRVVTAATSAAASATSLGNGYDAGIGDDGDAAPRLRQRTTTAALASASTLAAANVFRQRLRIGNDGDLVFGEFWEEE